MHRLHLFLYFDKNVYKNTEFIQCINLLCFPVRRADIHEQTVEESLESQTPGIFQDLYIACTGINSAVGAV
jgi:hypothetical protein